MSPQHEHIWVVYQRGWCEVCDEAHLDDDGCHLVAVYFAHTFDTAVAWLRSARARAQLPDGWWWETWSEPIDDYFGSCTGACDAARAGLVVCWAADGTELKQPPIWDEEPV